MRQNLLRQNLIGYSLKFSKFYFFWDTLPSISQHFRCSSQNFCKLFQLYELATFWWFFWDFKTKRLGKIEHTLSRDYFLSNFKSDFCLFERFLSLSSHSLIGRKMVTCSRGPRFIRNGRKGSKSIKIRNDPILTPDCYELGIHDSPGPIMSEIWKSCSVLVRHGPKI